jgi:RNA ligase (TIGR02306 family)
MNNLATVEKIDDVYPHSNADSLECVKVRNCQVIVPKGRYTVNQKILFIWPDSILPDVPWAGFYKAKSTRVRAIKLRNEWSMGIVEEFSNVDINLEKYNIGEDVSALIGVTKYEPPLPVDLSARGLLPYGIPKTDEENHYNFNDLPYGKHCVVSRKRDGSSCSFYYNLDEDDFGVLSRSLSIKPECHNNYTSHLNQYNIQEKLTGYCKKHNVSLCIRGESFGNGTNSHKSNVDAKLQSTWEMYSVWDIKNRRYISIDEEHNFISVANECELLHVPILETNTHLTPELVAKYADQNLGFEGVVIHCDGSTFKVINKEYDSRK